MFFSDIESLSHTAIVGTLGYIGVIVLLRVSGKRTLSKWNSFDFVVTIAFGSILASILVSRSTSLSQGLLAFGMLVLFQFGLTWVATRSSLIQQLIKSEPTLLFYQGEFRNTALKQERVSAGEVLAAVRHQGHGDLKQVAAVILETDGSFSILQDLGDGSALRDVRGFLHPKSAPKM